MLWEEMGTCGCKPLYRLEERYFSWSTLAEPALPPAARLGSGCDPPAPSTRWPWGICWSPAMEGAGQAVILMRRRVEFQICLCL